MLEAFYHLDKEPFRLSPDPRFCFRHRSYAKAKAYMQYAVQRGEGFIMITGRPGTGKTTLIEDLLAELTETEVVSARLTSAQLEADDLLRMVGFTFGIGVEGLDKASVLQRIERFVKRQAQMGRRALLVIDEAQALSANALEELRLLSNLQADAKPLLQVFLVGQEPLRNVVRGPGMEQLHQRLIATCHLQPLDAQDTRTYVEHRLRCAGWTGDPRVSGGALLLIYRFSEGVPRRINLVASRLLLHGSVEQKHELGGEDARVVVEELRDEALMPVGEGGDSNDDSEMFGDLNDLDSADVGVDLLPIPAVPEAGDDRPCVVELNAESAGHAYPLPLGKTYVGRVPECAIVLRSNFTSRKHAEIEYCADGKLFVRDLGSRNGTWIEGRRIDEHLLSDGERIQFGSKTVFQVRIPGGAPVQHEPPVATYIEEVPAPGEAHTATGGEQHIAAPPTIPIEAGDRGASLGETMVMPWPEAQVSRVKSMLNGPVSANSPTGETLPVLTDGQKAGPELAAQPGSKPRFPNAQPGSTGVQPAVEAVAHTDDPVERDPPARGNVRWDSAGRRQRQPPDSARLGDGKGQGRDTGKTSASKDGEAPTNEKATLSGTRLGLYWLFLLVSVAAIFLVNSESFKPVRADIASWVAFRLDQIRPAASGAGEGAQGAGTPVGGSVDDPGLTGSESMPTDPPRVIPESAQAAFRTGS